MNLPVMFSQAIRKFNLILDKMPVELKKKRKILTSQEASDITYVLVDSVYYVLYLYIYIYIIHTLLHIFLFIILHRLKLAGQILEGGGMFLSMDDKFSYNYDQKKTQIMSGVVSDYDFQTALMEGLCRMVTPYQRKELADQWFSMAHVAKAFANICDSEFETVKFKNMIN